MTRQADPKATGYFSVKARNENEHQLIGDLKRLARQDDIDLADLVFEGIQYMLKAHKWPFGNPQVRLSVFQQETLLPLEGKCKCGCSAVVWAVDLRGIKEVDCCFCQNCFNNVPGRYDPKIWKITNDNRPNYGKF